MSFIIIIESQREKYKYRHEDPDRKKDRCARPVLHLEQYPAEQNSCGYQS
jgi:hypothetical protein